MTSVPIPAKAVEAAVKAWDHHWGDRYGDEALEEMGEEVRVALEAAAPHMQPPNSFTPENFRQMVDAALEHAGTPRHRLFEYPHRDDDSRKMIRDAEALVRTILRLNRP